RRARPGWHGRERVPVGSGLGDVEKRATALHQPGGGRGPVLALRRPGVDLPVSGPVPALSEGTVMSSEPAKDDPHAAYIDRQVRAYVTVFGVLMVLTLVTVWVSSLGLSLRLAVGVALAIATVK